MFIATKTIYTVDKIFYKGQEVPKEFVSDHLIQIGAIVLKNEPKVENVELKVKEEPKVEQKVENVEPVKNIKPNPIRPKVERKPRILVEDSSNVKVVKE